MSNKSRRKRNRQQVSRREAQVAEREQELQEDLELVSETVVFQAQGYRGPVPPPELVDGYQRAIPNGGERVLALAEREAEHRHAIERRHLRASVFAHILGQLLAFVLATTVIVSGVYLVYHDKDVAGFAAILTGAAGIIASILRRSPSQ